MANRLAESSSPYLEQHKDNPVDWWPWGPDAFTEARTRDVPLLISVGYAACHWCHVMAHESFEDPGVAELINKSFVAVKVDREERPDVDAVYMTATQAMTGQGGWPMTVFATPDGQPFFCGTYFPRANFTRLLESVDTMWREQREAVLRQGAAVVAAIGGRPGQGPTSPLDAAVPDAAVPDAAVLDGAVLDTAVAALSDELDEQYGGFGGAPKFPPHMPLLFLLRHYAATGNERALEMVRHTCEQMARGGIYDQIAGGFARYSVDGQWTVPHFEKMLYDNALLLRVYTHLWRITGDPLAEWVARQTATFLSRDLATGEGGFASALDADTDGVEGLTYVWTPDQLREVLGDEDAAFAADLFGVTEAGTFEHGMSVLRMLRDINAAEDGIKERYSEVLDKLTAARWKRPQPGRDDKVVAAWNGLAITALVEFAGVVRALSERPDRHALFAVRLAAGAGQLLADVHLVDGRLRRVSRDGVVGAAAGVLEDYGCVAEAYCALHQATGEARWLELAGQLLDTALAHFSDGRGGYYDTADDAEALVARPADPTDNATPSGLSALAAALTTYTALTGQTRYREAAEAALATVAPIAARHPRFSGYALAVGEALRSGPYEIAVAAGAGTAGAGAGVAGARIAGAGVAGAGVAGGAELVNTAWRHLPPGAVVVSGQPDRAGVPLLAGRPMLDGQPTAYVCRGFVCDRPVTDPAELAALLRPRGCG